MKILAIDTALDACAVALVSTRGAAVRTEGAVVARSEDIGRGHAERLTAMVAEVMDEAGHWFEQVDRIAVTVGPGSFTGIRVGLSVARGLGLALGRPVVGIGTLEAIERDVRATQAGGAVAVVLDARRGEVYAGVYDRDGREIVRPTVLPVAEAATRALAAEAVLAGSGADLVAAVSSSPLTIVSRARYPSIEAVATLGALAQIGLAAPGPLYVRAPDAKPQDPSRGPALAVVPGALP